MVLGGGFSFPVKSQSVDTLKYEHIDGIFSAEGFVPFIRQSLMARGFIPVPRARSDWDIPRFSNVSNILWLIFTKTTSAKAKYLVIIFP
jgi:hypothetical protein